VANSLQDQIDEKLAELRRLQCGNREYDAMDNGILYSFTTEQKKRRLEQEIGELQARRWKEMGH
jgi:hypothetical protein